MDSGAYGFVAVGGAGIAAALYAVSRINVRELFLDVSKPGAYWRLFALALALANLKSLPFGWHLRLIRGLLTHISFGSKRPTSPGPSALFQPLITSTHTSLWETDYNLHKSNSTYFSDLDIARMHLVTCLLKTGLHKATHEPPTPEHDARYGKQAGGGRIGVMLGGVACNFKREIKPYEGYEIWTRVLAWDRKWLYLVSHVVRKGAVRPPGYSQQKGRKGGRRKGEASSTATATPTTAPAAHPAIFASSIAKYVFKSGRITIPPELVLTQSELLPEKPEGWVEAGGSTSPDVGATELTNEAAAATVQSIASLAGDEVITGAEDAAEMKSWTWERIEAERQRGMQIAQHYAELDQLHQEFTADTVDALGEW